MVPFKGVVFLFPLVNLRGFPIISGFYLKDSILEFIKIRSRNKLII